MKRYVLCAVAVLFLGVSAVFAGGSSDTEAEKIGEKQYSVSANDISEIRIMVKDRAVEIIPSSDDDIHLTYYENGKEFYTIEKDMKGVLTVQSDSDKGFFDYFGFSNAALRPIVLAVPNPLACSLVISTTKNDFVLPQIEFTGSVSVTVNDGNIVLDKSTPKNDITLSAKNGNITGVLIGSYDDFVIQSKAHKGKSNLPESKKGGNWIMTVNTNNGDIDISLESGK